MRLISPWSAATFKSLFDAFGRWGPGGLEVERAPPAPVSGILEAPVHETTGTDAPLVPRPYTERRARAAGPPAEAVEADARAVWEIVSNEQRARASSPDLPVNSVNSVNPGHPSASPPPR